MLSSRKSRSLTCWLLLLAIGGLQLISADDNDFVPSFPAPPGNKRFSFISEEFDQLGGYQTREEYVDFDIGKATFIQTKSTGRETFHVDAASLTTYYYKPYECAAYLLPEIPEKFPQDGFLYREDWVTQMEGHIKKFPLTGVTAIWLNAKGLSKTYSRASSIYSASKDVYQAAHKWVVNMGYFKASFYFNEVKNDKTPIDQLLLTLETIELEAKDKQKTTINVLAYDFDIDKDVFKKELQLPVSYGCYTTTKFQSKNEKDLIDRIAQWHLGERFRVEAVATKQSSGGTRLTSTVSLELAHDGQPKPWLKLLRQRSSKLDTKSVLDHGKNIKYDIDMLKGTCAMSNMGDAWPAEETRMTISFPNGLELALDNNMLDVLFLKTNGYQFTKSTEEGGVTYVYMTLPAAADLFADKSRGSAVRIVRKYSLKDEYSVRLESVTMWLMEAPASSRADIHEIYHFTILESDKFLSNAEKARIFDVSEECYLNNDAMKYGRDYAWLEFHYTLIAGERASAPKEARSIVQTFYGNMQLFANIGFNRIPRMELMFDEVGLTLRMLLLDSPPLDLVYGKTPNVAIEPRKGDEKDYFEEIAPDARHCAELCRLHYCQAFSFCASSYSCVLASPQTDDLLGSRLVSPRTGCDLFKMPDPGIFRLSDYQKSRLHHFIGQIQRHDLANLQLPPLPDELTVPQSESGISQARMYQLWNEYEKKAREILAGANLNAVSRFGGSLVAVPDRFEVEQDPLAEFGLDGRDQLEAEDESMAPAFHEGLSQFRFNYRAFEDQQEKSADKREARRYLGVDYEQCALACVDGKCSSFSYCKQRQECIITNIWDLHQSGVSNFIQSDADCVIAQRDFLGKFHLLPEVKRPTREATNGATPTTIRRAATAANPSECAHGCVVETGFNCLAFTYCRADSSGGADTCFYSESRSLEASRVKSSPDEQATGCDHYSRSYLADFLRIEYRQIVPDALEQLKTSQVVGQSVDRCAEMCATELMDCTAFQFCFDPEASRDDGRQRCTMIESPPEGARREDYSVVLAEDGKVSRAGKLFTNNLNCHVFSLRKGSSEAELRQLALNPLRKGETADDEQQLAGGGKWGGMSLLGGLMLFVCSTLVFSAMGVVFVLAARQNERLRNQMDHLRALFGRYQ